MSSYTLCRSYYVPGLGVWLYYMPGLGKWLYSMLVVQCGGTG